MIDYQWRSSFDVFNTQFDWPDTVTLKDSQILFDVLQDDAQFYIDDAGLVRKKLKNGTPVVVIPSHDTPLLHRIIIIAHSGNMGHRGYQRTLEIIQKHFFWEGMENDIRSFLDSCLNCLKSRKGNTVPRPYGVHVQPQTRGEIIAVDYLYVESSTSNSPHNYSYILVIKDIFSGMVQLVPTERADSASALEALMMYFSLYKIPRMIMTDGARHFDNKLSTALCSALGIKHHITSPYMSFSNGSVERVNREVLQLFKLLLRDKALPTSAWPSLLPMVMSVINDTKATRLGDLSPKQVYMGLESKDPFQYIFTPDHDFVYSPIHTDEIKNQVDSLLQSLDAFHKPLHGLTKKIQRQNNKTHLHTSMLGKRKSPNVDEGLLHRASGNGDDPEDDLDIFAYYTKEELRHCQVYFQRGDFVLVSEARERHNSKLIAKWTGPYRIIDEISPLVFQVESLVDQSKMLVHATRLRFYADSKLNVTEELVEHLSKDGRWLHKYEVEDIIGHQFNKSTMSWELHVKWLGFSHIENSFEDITFLFQDAPDLVVAYIHKIAAVNDVAAAELKSVVYELSNGTIFGPVLSATSSGKKKKAIVPKARPVVSSSTTKRVGDMTKGVSSRNRSGR